MLSSCGSASRAARVVVGQATAAASQRRSGTKCTWLCLCLTSSNSLHFRTSSLRARRLRHHCCSCDATAGQPKEAQSSSLSEFFYPHKFQRRDLGLEEPPTFFSDLPLERAGHLRDDKGRLKDLWSMADAKAVALIDGQRALVMEKSYSPAVLCPAAAAAEKLGVGREDAIFLGLEESGNPVFALPVGDEAGSLAAGSGATWVDVRQSGGLMEAPDAAVLAMACGLAAWNRSAAFCSWCGSPMAPSCGGHVRLCTSGSRSCRPIYPRIDPAAIMLVTCGDFLLLGHQNRWKPGWFSCLAGFLETGETLEMNVAREVKEEAGIDVDLSSVRYHSSQPWPFPRSLMVGFAAHAPPRGELKLGYASLTSEGRQAAISTGLRPEEVQDVMIPDLQMPQPDKEEIEEVCWFHRDWIREALKGPEAADSFYFGGDVNFGLPGPHTLARMMINGWLKEGVQEPWVGDKVQTVKLDTGTFKYVLSRVHGDGRSKLVVWGDTRAGYHNNVFQQVRSAARAVGLDADVLGGGRIEHYPEQGRCSIYGYSVAFGPAAHEVAAAIVRRRFPRYSPQAVAISYDGY